MADTKTKPKRSELEEFFTLLLENGEFLCDYMTVSEAEKGTARELCRDWQRVQREADTLTKMNPKCAERYKVQLREANDKIFEKLKADLPNWKEIRKNMRRIH